MIHHRKNVLLVMGLEKKSCFRASACTVPMLGHLDKNIFFLGGELKVVIRGDSPYIVIPCT